MKRHHILLILSLALLSTAISSCDIEETKVSAGRIFVELRDSSGSEVTGARIWLNGNATTLVTPDTLRQLAEGTYLVAVSKPGFLQASQEVSVSREGFVSLTLTTSLAPIASIELIDVPDGSALIVDNNEFAVVPPRIIGMSAGTWEVSAYLAGYVTNAPARWTITLAEGDTSRINPQFMQLSESPNIGSLAHVFALPSDQDSAIYRLQDYRGKIVLVSFFFYTCAPCLAEFPHIQEVYADPQYAGWLEFFGVDAIDPWSLFSIYKSTHPTLGLQFPLLWDQQQTLRTVYYEVASCPTNLLIDPTGMIRYRWLGVTEPELRGAVESLIAEFDTPI